MAYIGSRCPWLPDECDNGIMINYFSFLNLLSAEGKDAEAVP